MLALIYIGLACWLGHRFFQYFLRGGVERAMAASLNGSPAPLPLWVVAWPTSFVVGTLLLTWLTYLSACLGAATGGIPMPFGNTIGIGTTMLFLVLWFIWKWPKLRGGRLPSFPEILGWLRANMLEALLLGITLLLATLLMQQTFQLRPGQTLKVGLSVFSDFGTHLAVIRSFVLGENFPTEYPHFPAGNIRYHFMFQFLAGNLEFLGLPLDWAFNLPSILALASCILLLYALAVVLMGSRLAGILTVLFFFFRCSPAWWDFATEAGSLQELWSRLLSNSNFIGRTAHEDWGLWNQNVYLNQRHFAFGLAVLFLTLIMVFPLFREMLGKLHAGPEKRSFCRWLRVFAFEWNAWLPRKDRSALAGTLAIGIVLGMAGFWNGAAVITGIVLLFMLTWFSRHRLEYLIIAVLAVGLCYLQNVFFIGSRDLAVQPEIFVGFLAKAPTAKEIFRYYFDLLGLLPLVVVIAVALPWVGKIVNRKRPIQQLGGYPAGLGWLALVFLSLFLLATTVKLTPDVVINHKYVMIGVALLNILAAVLVAACLKHRFLALRIVGCGLIFCLTATGGIDFFACFKRNQNETAFMEPLNDPLLRWTIKETAPHDLFLTDWYALHPLLLSGRKIFCGWPYFAWSAGYDTAARDKIVRQIYGGTNPDEIRRLLRENHIRYIVIDNGNRQQQEYKLQEDLLRTLFPTVFTERDQVVLKVD